MIQKKAKLNTPAPDDALRVGDFQLLPIIARPPVITSHPIRNFNQTTWGTAELKKGKYEIKYNSIKPTPPALDTITVRVGTAVSWGLYCSDPSNLNNPNDSSNITFTWTRDDFPLHSINQQNNGYGSAFISFTEDECVLGIDGVYVCSLTNEYGTTTSVPFTLRVIELNSDIGLYTNKLLNGDAEGGLDEWNNLDGLVRGVVSMNGSSTSNTLTTYPTYDGYNYGTGKNLRTPLPFRFNSKLNKYQLFYGLYDTWNKLSNGDISNYSIATTALPLLPNWLIYGNTNRRSQVIPNEDYSTSDTPQGFFPGVRHLDRYNRNKPSDITLSDELSISKSRVLNYFTRNNIKIGESSTADFSQNIPLEGLESLIAGQVGGVDYLSAQFFSYVGVAISRYTIKVIINGKTEQFNWFVHKLDIFRSFLEGAGLDQIIPDPGTTIEVIPHADDTTTIYIDTLDSENKVLSTKELPGPTALDIWAVKDKTDWSTSLYPLYVFFKQNNNPITVFGQTYVRSNKIPKLYDTSYNGRGNLIDSNLEYQANSTSDQNAKFIFKRMGEIYAKYNKPWPIKGNWEADQVTEWGKFIPSDANYSRHYRSYVEKGAAAFIAVGGYVNLPPTTTSMNIRIEFNNNSPARIDTNPQGKDWSNPELYNSLFKTSPGGASTTQKSSDQVPRPHYNYGAPRCGITKMKLMIVPNADIASKDHVTYAIPDPQYTIAGVARDLALKPLWDTSTQSSFNYNLIKPRDGMVSPDPTTDFINQQEIADAQTAYNDSLLDPNADGSLDGDIALIESPDSPFNRPADPNASPDSIIRDPFDSGSVETE